MFTGTVSPTSLHSDSQQGEKKQQQQQQQNRVWIDYSPTGRGPN